MSLWMTTSEQVLVLRLGDFHHEAQRCDLRTPEL